MKNKYLLVVSIVALFFLSENTFAQSPSGSKKYPNTDPERMGKDSRKEIRNPNAQDIVVKGFKVDKRIVKYYNNGDIETLDVDKLKRLDFMYLKSYTVINEDPKPNESCKKLIDSEFDTGPYNFLRKQNERVVTVINKEGCTFKVELFSWAEVNQPKD